MWRPLPFSLKVLQVLASASVRADTLLMTSSTNMSSSMYCCRSKQGLLVSAGSLGTVPAISTSVTVASVGFSTVEMAKLISCYRIGWIWVCGITRHWLLLLCRGRCGRGGRGGRRSGVRSAEIGSGTVMLDDGSLQRRTGGESEPVDGQIQRHGRRAHPQLLQLVRRRLYQ